MGPPGDGEAESGHEGSSGGNWVGSVTPKACIWLHLPRTARDLGKATWTL